MLISDSEKLLIEKKKNYLVQFNPKFCALVVSDFDIMERITKSPGLQHISEDIFKLLDKKTLMNCRKVSKAWKNVIEGPLFLQKRLDMMIREENDEAEERSKWKNLLKDFELENAEIPEEDEDFNLFLWNHHFDMVKRKSYSAKENIINNWKLLTNKLKDVTLDDNETDLFFENIYDMEPKHPLEVVLKLCEDETLIFSNFNLIEFILENIDPKANIDAKIKHSTRQFREIQPEYGDYGFNWFIGLTSIHIAAMYGFEKVERNLLEKTVYPTQTIVDDFSSYDRYFLMALTGTFRYGGSGNGLLRDWFESQEQSLREGILGGKKISGISFSSDSHRNILEFREKTNKVYEAPEECIVNFDSWWLYKENYEELFVTEPRFRIPRRVPFKSKGRRIIRRNIKKALKKALAYEESSKLLKSSTLDLGVYKNKRIFESEKYLHLELMPYGFSSSYDEPPMRRAEVYFTRVGIEKVYDFSYEWNDEIGSFAEIDPYKSANMKYFTCYGCQKYPWACKCL